MPIADSTALRRGSGFEPARIYRRIPRGATLDVFALDMRTHKGENTPGLETHETPILGEEQLQWLIRGLRAAFTDFEPFWEFVAGPINAGSSGPNTLDGTFGPRLDFEAHGPVMGSPRSGEHQYFGHVEIPEDGREFRVRLINAVGRTVYSRTLTAA